MTAPAEPKVFKFEAAGMNTTFVIRMLHEDESTARRFAGNCFLLLEELEAILSRYRTDSEITRINQLAAGQTLNLSESTYRCLKQSFEAFSATAGLFDITLGVQTWKHPAEDDSLPVLKGQLSLDPDRPRIHCLEPGRQIDLGGIGKGFALDEMATLLKELGVSQGLLSAGASTHLSFGRKPWPILLRSEGERFEINLQDAALSSSGTGIQGAHVLRPDSGTRPVFSFKRVWITAPTAALADAFSTACLLMQKSELESFHQAREGKVSIFFEETHSQQIQRVP